MDKKRFTAALFLIVFILNSCSKDEPAELETFSAEAFAYDIGDGWEVNASVRVRGFSQSEDENNFYAVIAYDIDLVTPARDTLKGLVSRVEDKTSDEKIMDIPLEVQFELDTAYAEGEYTVIFNITDAATEQNALTSVVFQLMNE